MNFKAIFGTTFISVLVALVLYDMLIKGLIEKFTNKYDDSLEGKNIRLKSQAEMIDLLRSKNVA